MMTPEEVAKALDERRMVLRRMGGRPTTWRVSLGPYHDDGRRVRDLGELRAWPWANLILVLHGVDSFIVGLRPTGYYFGVGVVEGRYLPGPHRSRREGWAYVRFEPEEDFLPVVRTIARFDPLAELRIGKEESWPFARCPICSADAGYVYEHSLQCCDKKWEFEGRLFADGTFVRR